jgi:hypothetical protein
MVHALGEIRRVLVPFGTLVDLRPLADRWPVEILKRDVPIETGRMQDLPTGLADDQAANDAIEEATRCNWYHQISEITFPLYMYWDDPDEMIAYLFERWADFVQMDDQTLELTRAAWVDAGKNKRVRLKLKMLLTIWQKT